LIARKDREKAREKRKRKTEKRPRKDNAETQRAQR
jgi:hypothetical protein